jgi:hypothetical protein
MMVFLSGATTVFMGARWKALLMGLLIFFNVAGVIRVHPYYLTYFNELAGGPQNGFTHLADSNLDWGQGLVALREWLQVNAPRRRIQLAYFGGLHPEVLGFEYDVPGILPEPGPSENALDGDLGPRPGLHVISANYLAGMDYPVHDGMGGRRDIPERAYSFYRGLHPTAVIANCMFVYELTGDDVNQLRQQAGLPNVRVPGASFPSSEQ